ncbi:hypothetical protein INR49_001252 [Caranx melampygus]|nr:hypothetical protein INR49_001252 [Caranx melampygus]
MWITLFLMVFAWFSTTQASDDCNHVLDYCHQNHSQWTRCYEERLAKCSVKTRFFNFIRVLVQPSNEIEFTPTSRHRVHIPSSALQRSRGAASEQEEVMLLSTVINSTYFKVGPSQRKGRTKALTPTESAHSQPTVLGGLVLLVRAGNHPVANLIEPINLTFHHSELVASGACVFWKEQDHAAAYWSREGCSTHQNGTEFICSCNHLSFFAVLVNPVATVDQTNANTLSYITYIGSALSVIFTVISLIIYVFLQQRRPEKAIALHMQLTIALFWLHLSFLLGSFWVRLLKENEVDLVCKLVGLSLHWSLLATLTWTVLEGFHLYLLLVRVFNIYVRRYLLKLSLVGWGKWSVFRTVCLLIIKSV